MNPQPRSAGFRSRWGLLLVAAGALPPIFAVGAIVGIVQANEIAPESILAKASTLWMVTVLVGSFLVIPALAGLAVGVALSRRAPVAGTVVVLTSLAIMTGAYVLVMAGGVVYGLRDPTPPSQVLTEGDILPRLSLAGVAVFVTPFVLMVAVNALAIRATWSRNSADVDPPFSRPTEQTLLLATASDLDGHVSEHLSRLPSRKECGR